MFCNGLQGRCALIGAFVNMIPIHTIYRFLQLLMKGSRCSALLFDLEQDRPIHTS